MTSESNATNSNPAISIALVKEILYQFWSDELVASGKQEQGVGGETRDSDIEAGSDEEHEEKCGSIKVSRRALCTTM